MRRFYILAAFSAICILAFSGCDSGSSAPDITSIPLPDPIDPANFNQVVTNYNPLFPLIPGSTSLFKGETPGGTEEILVEVTDRKKLVQGVTTTVVRDRVWLDGVLIEDTDDWYAQDNDGNVWYLGEDVKNYENGVVVDRHGSWESGVDGALAGIIMWASPNQGSVYYQEFYAGEAEDVGEVLALNETVTVPYGSLSSCVKTEDTTPLEPDVLEYKFFCPGLGHALTVDITEGGLRFELVEATGYDRPTL